MIYMLIYLIIALILVGLVFWAIQYLPIPQPFLNIIRVLLVLIVILWILFYMLPGLPHGHWIN
jgi:hypothetical protein